MLSTTDFPVVYIDHLEDKNKRRHNSQGTMDLVTCVGLNSVESVTLIVYCRLNTFACLLIACISFEIQL